MGTRSLTYVYTEGGQPIVCMYRQFDGYVAGHGVDLAEFLNSGKLVNGIPMGSNEVLFNGMGDLAAQMVAHFKKDVGGFYLYPTNDLTQDCWQEYEYHVFENRVVVYEGQYTENNVIFSGTWKEFASFCNGEETESTPVSKPFVNDQVSRDWLKNLLHETVVEVTFTKKDGTERVMRCTLDEDVVPPTGDKQRTVKRSESAQPVFDIRAQEWRSFRWDSVKSIAFEV